MNANNYWQKRAEELLKENIMMSDELTLETANEFDKVIIKIQKQIAYYLEKITTDGELDINKAMQTLSREEFNDLLDQLNYKAERNAHNINYLQAIEYETRVELDKLYKDFSRNTGQMLSKAYENTYYKMVYEMQHFERFYQPLRKIPVDRIQKIIQEPWGKNVQTYSTTIWKNKYILENELRESLLNMAVTGESLDTASKALAERMGVQKSAAKRLIHTENAHIANTAMADACEKGTAKQYQIIATLDLRTSQICRDMDYKIFDYKDRKEGVNYPPFHPNCRTRAIPYYGDIQKEFTTTRMARNPVTGKSERVEAMSYHEWYDKYVVENSEIMFKQSDITSFASLKDISQSDIINIDNIDGIKDHFTKYNIDLKGFDNIDIEKTKLTLSGVDDVIKKYPKAKDAINYIAYDKNLSYYGQFGGMNRILIGNKGLSNYNTGIHETIHALDWIMSKGKKTSLSETISRKAVKNLKLRINGKDTKKLVMQFVGSNPKDIRNYKEWLSYALEAELTKSTRRNKLSKEIYKLLEEACND